MKLTIIMTLAALAASPIIHGHCGKCAADGKAAGDHAHHQESACSATQLEIYFDAQEGLASDNLTAAKEASKRLIAMGNEMGCSLDGDSCCSAELEAANEIAESKDIAVARQAFKNWSDVLIAKVESGLPEGMSAYKMRCPMAFGNKGGSWLQNNRDLRNPYYGAMMLKCGMIQQEYASGEKGTASEEHGHHES